MGEISMKVLDCFKLSNKMTVISCEIFSDNQITQSIKVDGKILTDFEVETPKDCFSVPKTRNIVVHGELVETPKELLFV